MKQEGKAIVDDDGDGVRQSARERSAHERTSHYLPRLFALRCQYSAEIIPSTHRGESGEAGPAGAARAPPRRGAPLADRAQSAGRYCTDRSRSPLPSAVVVPSRSVRHTLAVRVSFRARTQ